MIEIAAPGSPSREKFPHEIVAVARLTAVALTALLPRGIRPDSALEKLLFWNDDACWHAYHKCIVCPRVTLFRARVDRDQEQATQSHIRYCWRPGVERAGSTIVKKAHTAISLGAQITLAGCFSYAAHDSKLVNSCLLDPARRVFHLDRVAHLLLGRNPSDRELLPALETAAVVVLAATESIRIFDSLRSESDSFVITASLPLLSSEIEEATRWPVGPGSGSLKAGNLDFDHGRGAYHVL